MQHIAPFECMRELKAQLEILALRQQDLESL